MFRPLDPMNVGYERGPYWTEFAYHKELVPIWRLEGMFPDLDMLGVDLVLPDFTYLRENADRVEGAIITHGHEDHMGGLSYLLRELSFPIYGSALTLGLARHRIEEAGVLAQ